MTATIEHGKVRLGPAQKPAATPGVCPEAARGLFTAMELPDGRTHLVNDRGESCGVFVNRQLAEGTAAFLR